MFSENNWNGVFAVSSAIIDSKVGLTIGVSIPSLDNRIINLTTTGLNNYNSLSSNISILNTFKTDYLNISEINVNNKLINADENINNLYNICNDLGATGDTLDIKLNVLSISGMITDEIYRMD